MTFFSFLAHIECSMTVNGGDNYKEPHIHKAVRRKNGEDIERYICDNDNFLIGEAPSKKPVGS